MLRAARMHAAATSVPPPTPGTAARRPSSRRRTLPRWSRRAEALGLVALTLGMLCLFYFEVIFENRTFLPFGSPAEVLGPAPPWQFSGTVRPNPYRLDSGGSAWQLEPWARIVAASYAAGQLPLWNPHQFFGTPLAADAQPGAFDVLRLPALLTEHAWGWDVYYLSQSALCLALTYVFGRSVGFGPIAAFLAAAAYAFSGFMFIRGNMHYAEIYHLLPGVLWGIERVLRGQLRSGVAIVAVGVGLSALAGMPEVTLLALLYAGSFALFRVAWHAGRARSWRFGAQRALLLGLGGALGIGLAAPMLVPLLEYLPIAYSIHPPARGLGLEYLPLRNLSFIGVPFINGLPAQSLSANNLHPVDDYSGAAVLALAVLGGLALSRPSRGRGIAAFALLSAAIWGAKLFGVPGIEQLGGLPLLVQTLIEIFGTPLLSLSVALLAGAGVQALDDGLISRRIALVGGGVFVAYLALAVRLNWQTLLAAGQQHAATTVGLAAAAGLAVLVCALLGRRWPRSLAAAGVSVVAIGELLVLAPHNVYSDRADSLARPPYVAWLQQQQAGQPPFRVFSNDGLLYPDYAGAFGLDDPRVVDGLWPLRTWQFVKTFLSPSISDRYVGGFGHPELPTRLLDNPWLDFSNVRYVLRPADEGPSDATLAQVIVAAHYPPTDLLHVAQYTIGGQRHEVLAERTPGDATLAIHPTAARPQLTFLLALDPNLPAPVEFVASIGDHEVFRRTLDPANPADREWVPGSIDLGPFIGQDVTLRLQTRALQGAAVTPGWGELHFAPRPDLDQFRQVYAGEVSIWENTHAAPRALLVADVQRAASPAAAISSMQAADFDPLRSAVIEGDAQLPSASALPAGGPGTATITSYGPQHIDIAVQAQTAALVVLTDSYYPGWTATLDGAPTPIFPTDLAFRGVLVPPGPHQLHLEYAPASFRLGLGAAGAAVIILAASVWLLRPRRGG